jgi:hypothetical protein
MAWRFVFVAVNNFMPFITQMGCNGKRTHIIEEIILSFVFEKIQIKKFECFNSDNCALRLILSASWEEKLKDSRCVWRE